ncbi:CubicO group peptidase (beta-lactamase class C family) [Stackebrandtia endophytica]|uniref:CubicO group peptidase (Beta-lactamase class C family) n=1 Tax=Stackebrandtia endophytica TaxID=1496996 RepID=A0A543B1E1_9ACTN|nr:serine hydrolase domain-containing protein [Stackebrandtia endophytica]TQL78639.1 CubicO group peptidase (beta-lactamase class C family) [Stackebrandtia endophytica]
MTAIFDNRDEPDTIPSVSMAVLDASGLTVKAFNCSESTLFQAASISKAVAALTTLRLVADDVIGLDDDVNDHLTSWKLPGVPGQPGRVTIRQLLSHSGALTTPSFPGYPTSQPLPTLPQILDGTGDANTDPVRIDGIPGLGFRYSGGGYVILQQLLEDVTAGPFAALTEELVFTPCEMSTATYAAPGTGQAAIGHVRGQAIHGDWHRHPEQATAGMWCTPTDLINFVTAIREAANGDTALLPQDLAREMLTPQAAPLGLGMFLEADPAMNRFGHTGGNYGYGCFVTAARYGDHAAAVMTNGNEAGRFCRTARDTLMAATDWPHTPPPADEPGGTTIEEWIHRYAGEYVSDTGTSVTVGCPDGPDAWLLQPGVSVDGGPSYAVQVVNLQLAVVKGIPTQVRFEQDEHGSARGLTITQWDNELTATKRIDQPTP